ncbi:hypothetical protein GCT13_09610 [Paraburkholderia sp. CNPSo 3157]|uniref:Tle cognate immunity protein 4 C-terminal domain-containing protein n=1 Tax=Paraburkholderia franconis TaxID=2654983 RepID=A0A7X1N893_9BURK|nr:hypothetical protein [Paraburkholderia franconis]MPW17180.1 hypothetical protein [Paraburkholderia franconis]
MNKVRVAFSSLFCFMLFSQTGTGMAKSDKDTMGFGLNGYNMSNAESSIGLEDGKFLLVMKGQVKRGSGQPAPMHGIGVFEGAISDRDRAKMYAMRNTVCSIKQLPRNTPGNTFIFVPSVTCDDGREIAIAIDSFSSLPEGTGAKLVTPTEELVKSFYETGDKVAKLDASTSMVPKDGKLLVTLKFINSGHTEIAFKSPATWEGYYDPMSKASYAEVGGVKSTNEGEFFSLMLGREQMINRSDYHDDIIRIPPGQVRYASFLAYPDGRFKKGRYSAGGGAVIREILAPEKLRGVVEFTFQDTVADFVYDYPANQKEMNAFEAYRRKRLFDDIHGVGDGVEEAGYYRAYGEDNKRDDFPVLLRKGEKFPGRTMEHQVGGSRKSIGPATIWRWEAYPDSKVSAVTGEPCPRSGYWIPGMPSGLSANGLYMFSLAADKRRIAENEVMPRLGLGNDSYLTWTWLGDVT